MPSKKKKMSLEAINSYKNALELNPDYDDAYINLYIYLRNVIFTTPSTSMQTIIEALLNKDILASPYHLSKAAISLLSLEPVLINDGEETALARFTEKPNLVISQLSKLPLLLKLMSVVPVDDISIELLLKNTRAHILSEIVESSEVEVPLRFQTALAIQCYINEYIYDVTVIEQRELRRLENIVKMSLSKGEQPLPHILLCLASYRSLSEYEWIGNLNIVPDISRVIEIQVINPRKEKQVKATIPLLNDIFDCVSKKVKNQYEENPYPKWLKLGLERNPQTILEVAKYCKLSLSSASLKEVGSPDILVAGCGTGQQSISTAARFKSSKVLAVDLSLSSLAYAKRKTEELNFSNIEYMQADILDLNKLDRTFDVIECTGVLHHMDDPLVGWKILTDCLKPGGLMKVGLYSELARQHIVKMREEINQLGLGSSDEDMKAFRELVIKSDEEHHKLIRTSQDFFSLSTIRDLLFHVQEHRFTIPRIRDYLDELGLFFCGFESAPIVESFTRINGASDALYDLQNGRSMKMITQERLQVCTSSGVKKFHNKPLDKRHFYTP